MGVFEISFPTVIATARNRAISGTRKNLQYGLTKGPFEIPIVKSDCNFNRAKPVKFQVTVKFTV